MLALLAQSTAPSPLVTAILFTAVSFPVGAVLGYLCGYRFKRQYERVARELASLRGENFRGELTTIGIPRPGASKRTSAMPPAPHAAAESDRELSELRAERIRLSEQLAEVRQTLAVADARVAELTEQAAAASSHPENSPSASPLTGTEAWQLAQMHKEQIMMQLRLDQHVERIAVLSQELAATRQQVDQWRQRATEQERAVGALQREREQLQTRLAEIETA